MVGPESMWLNFCNETLFNAYFVYSAYIYISLIYIISILLIAVDDVADVCCSASRILLTIMSGAVAGCRVGMAPL